MDDKAAEVLDWRLHSLLDAGCPFELANRLANQPWYIVDLHRAVDVVKALAEQGKPVELAEQILL